jgi:molecular chaperone DnaJ
VARDYYKVLGISRSASDVEIKRAYRRLARQLHPDVTGDDPRSTERFKEITHAYEVLSDSKRRRAYDMFGAPDGAGGRAAPPDGFGIGDLFEEIFGKSAKKPAEPGVDVEHDVRVTFAEGFSGTERTVDVQLNRTCSVCAGKGHPQDQPPKPCTDCKGTGVKMGATLPLRRACPTCDGRGKIFVKVCSACGGEGTRVEKDHLKVTIPPGVDTGTRLRLRGKGAAGKHGGPTGDLYVVVTVEPDERFERHGDDLVTDLRIGLKDALLGGKVDVALPDGAARMAIPPGTQGGQTFRIKGRGFKKLANGVPGDVLVTVQLRVPRTLNDSQRALIEQLADAVPDL